MRSVVWYVVLVGIPVAAMLGILRLGERLVAPRAAHGQYSVAFDSTGAGHCLSALVAGQQKRLNIAQSGPKLDVTFGSVELFGAIDGDSIYAAAPTTDNALLRAASCLTVDTVAVSAALPARGASDTDLAGSFLFPGCTTCPSVPFRATRLPDRSRNAAN
ncbi:MAG TPA: hypothetical protein VH762_06255 [Gemmatimonadaceae bacterium]|jgi:hypothetical protein